MSGLAAAEPHSVSGIQETCGRPASLFQSHAFGAEAGGTPALQE